MCSTEIAKFFTVGSVVKPCTRSAHAHKRSRAAFHLIRGRVPRHVSACPALHHPPTFQPSNLYNALCLHSKIRPSVSDKNRGFSNGWCGPFTTFPPLVNIQLDLLTFLTRPTLHVQSISTPRSDIFIFTQDNKVPEEGITNQNLCHWWILPKHTSLPHR